MNQLFNISCYPGNLENYKGRPFAGIVVSVFAYYVCAFGIDVEILF